MKYSDLREFVAQLEAKTAISSASARKCLRAWR